MKLPLRLTRLTNPMRTEYGRWEPEWNVHYEPSLSQPYVDIQRSPGRESGEVIDNLLIF